LNSAKNESTVHSFDENNDFETYKDLLKEEVWLENAIIERISVDYNFKSTILLLMIKLICWF
jgi:hypothetical protein